MSRYFQGGWRSSWGAERTVVQLSGATCETHIHLYVCSGTGCPCVCLSSAVPVSAFPSVQQESLLTTVLAHSLHFLLSKTAKALSHCLVQLLFLPTRMRKEKKNLIRLKLKSLHVNQIAGSCSQGEFVILQEWNQILNYSVKTALLDWNEFL